MKPNSILFLIAVSLLATALAPASHAAVPVATDHVVINEVLYDPIEGNESVELYNPTDEDVNVTGWTLSDGDYCASWQQEIRVVQGTVEAHGYLVVELPNTYGGFTCNNLATSDDLTLYDLQDEAVDEVSWGTGDHVAEDGDSLQRDLVLRRDGGVNHEATGPASWSPGAPTLGSANLHAG